MPLPFLSFFLLSEQMSEAGLNKPHCFPELVSFFLFLLELEFVNIFAYVYKTTDRNYSSQGLTKAGQGLCLV